MSFSSEIKAELCRAGCKKKCCAAAESYGVLLYAQSFSDREIRIVTASPALAERLPRLFSRAFGLDFDETVFPRGETGRARFLITAPEKLDAVFERFGLERGQTLAQHVNYGVLEEDCCRLSFLRGAFLAGGSATDPQKGFHLEFATPHRSVCRETVSLLQEQGFEPKEAQRSGNWLLYYKKADLIADLLTRLGASGCAMEVMTAKVERDMRNTITRRVNCDSANADKIVEAAQSQLEAIRRLVREYGLDGLPDPLKDTALLRIANPEASLADLARLSSPPVSKSCLSHRLKKILAYAEAIKE